MRMDRRHYRLSILILIVLLTGCSEENIKNKENLVKNNEVQLETNVEVVTIKEEPSVVEILPIHIEEVEPDEYVPPIITNSDIQKEIIESTAKFSEVEIKFTNEIMGLWTYEDEDDLFMELRDNVESIGVSDGQYLTTGEFSVKEINVVEQYIIIHVLSESIEYDQEKKPEKYEYYSKLTIRNKGKQLHYVSDYLDKKIESTWTR